MQLRQKEFRKIPKMEIEEQDDVLSQEEEVEYQEPEGIDTSKGKFEARITDIGFFRRLIELAANVAGNDQKKEARDANMITLGVKPDEGITSQINDFKGGFVYEFLLKKEWFGLLTAKCEDEDSQDDTVYVTLHLELLLKLLKSAKKSEHLYLKYDSSAAALKLQVELLQPSAMVAGGGGSGMKEEDGDVKMEVDGEEDASGGGSKKTWTLPLMGKSATGFNDTDELIQDRGEQETRLYIGGTMFKFLMEKGTTEIDLAARSNV